MAVPTGGALVPIRETSWCDRQRFPLRRETTTIGRSIESDIRINHRSVSRKHAELAWNENNLVIWHLSQTNDTFVNGMPVQEPKSLNTGDLIEIGEIATFRVEVFDEADTIETMPIDRARRQIRAILSADVVGYSKLTASDEIQAAKQVQTTLALIGRETSKVDGSIVDVRGDGILAIFSSIATALSSAIAMQEQLAERNRNAGPGNRIQLRIGLNSGDVIFDDHDAEGNLYGDAINVAARVQNLAEPGGILLTGAVFDQMHGAAYGGYRITKVEEAAVIERPVRLYKVEMKK